MPAPVSQVMRVVRPTRARMSPAATASMPRERHRGYCDWRSGALASTGVLGTAAARRMWRACRAGHRPKLMLHCSSAGGEGATATCRVLQPAEAARRISGLQIWTEFCTAEEEHGAVAWLDGCSPPWAGSQFGVPVSYGCKHFGLQATLRPRGSRPPDPSRGEADLPTVGVLAEFLQRLHDDGSPWRKALRGLAVNEANVNDYRRGESRLHLHWDDRALYGNTICSVSLLGDVVMSFAKGPSCASSFARDGPGGGKAPEEYVLVHVPARSLLVLSGPARYEWQHGILEASDFQSERRVAIILRQVVPRRGASGPAQAGEGRARDGTKAPRALAGRGQPQGVRMGAEGESEPSAGPASPPQPGRASALFISTNWPDPGASAAGAVTHGRIGALKANGFRVAFAAPSRPSQAMARLADACGEECIRIGTNDEDSVVGALRAVAPDVVVFDGFNAEERFGHYVRAALPGSLRALDMQDFHALRLGREQLLASGAPAPDVVTYLPESSDEVLLRELAALHRSDVVWAISDAERDLLVQRYAVPAWKVSSAPFAYPPLSLGAMPGYAERKHVMFIGNWRHRPNRDCAAWLIRDIWPRVHEALPDLQLHVYGSCPRPEDMALSDKRINATVCGYCKDVEKTMRSHLLLAAPLRYGAGVKGKLTDAMWNGLVTVTTEVGAEGLTDSDGYPGILVASTASIEEKFAQAIVSACTHEAEWRALQGRGFGFMSRHFDSRANGEKLVSGLSRALRELPARRAGDYFGSILWRDGHRSTEFMAKYIATKEELQRLRASLPAGSA